jgi:hypothetical protein
MGENEVSITDSALLHLQLECSPSADDLAAFTPRRGPTLRVRLRVAEKAPRWLPYVVTRLGELAHLAYEPDDDVSSPHPEAVKRALPELVRFMGSDTPTPSVVPTFDGAVQFVWHKGGWDIEVEVGPKETLFWAQRRDGTTAWHGSLDEHLDTIRAVLSNLESPA